MRDLYMVALKKKNLSVENRRLNIEIKKRVMAERKALNMFFETQTSLCDYFENKISKYGDLKAVTDEYSKVEMTYAELNEQISQFAAGMQALGLQKGQFVSLFSENNGRWMLADHAILRNGAVSVDRGSQAPAEELDYILKHSDSVGVIVQNAATFNKLKDIFKGKNLKFIILLFGEETDDLPVFTFEEILEIGKGHNFVKPELTIDDNAVMLYTSGTTGLPKGVLLTHKNILSQFPSIHECFNSQPGEKTLQILPIWHAYERISQTYYYLSGCHLHFTTIPNLKNDLLKYNVDTFMSVPRIWEALRIGIYQKLKQKSALSYYIFDFAVQTSINYQIHKMYSERRITNKKKYHKLLRLYHKIIRSFIKPLHLLFKATIYQKIKDATGANFRASMSGGGSLSMKDQLFYDALGINLREGYGLTETSPVLTIRPIKDKNYLGCAGKPIKSTEIKIVDPNTLEELGLFKKGLIMARGPQVMKGYYKDPEATAKVIDEKGWFNTGDLGWLTGDNNLVIVGRIKETIVLSNGENVEPVPIEEACLGSPYIEQIVLVGQDKSSIGALVVPSQEALQKCGVLAKDLKSNKTLSIKNPNLRDLIKKELNTYIKNKSNLKSFEKIKQFEILKENFSVQNGMVSQTAKIKRNVVFDTYKNLISKMFNDKK